MVNGTKERYVVLVVQPLQWPHIYEAIARPLQGHCDGFSMVLHCHCSNQSEIQNWYCNGYAAIALPLLKLSLGMQILHWFCKAIAMYYEAIAIKQHYYTVPIYCFVVNQSPNQKYLFLFFCNGFAKPLQWFWVAIDGHVMVMKPLQVFLDGPSRVVLINSRPLRCHWPMASQSQLLKCQGRRWLSLLGRLPDMPL